MREAYIFKLTKSAYIGLLRPTLEDDEHSQDIAVLIALSPSVTDEVIVAMLAGSSWRERLLGFCMAMSKQKQPSSFIDGMFRSLRDPRCLAIVPTCAALALLARRGVFVMQPSFAELFDRAPFDGEVGWAVDKAMHFAGLRPDHIHGHAPNDGQSFEAYVQFYESIRVT